MLLSTSAFFLALGLATLASTTPTVQQSSVENQNAQTFNDSATMSTPMTARPRPNETIGEYFDRLLSKNDIILQERQLRRTKKLTEVTWSKGKTNFNISMSRCVSLSDVAGIYNSKDGVRLNATIRDIIDDLHVREGSEAANRIKYASRVRENSQLAIDTANTYLKKTVPDYTPIDNYSHNELRHLLAPFGQYVALIARTKVLFEIMVGISIGLQTPFENASISEPITVAVVASGTLFARGCESLAHGDSGLDFLQATILNAFLAWFREVMYAMKSSDSYGLTSPKLNRSDDMLLNRVQWPISRTALQTAMGRLQDASEPSLRLGSHKALDAGNSCSNS